jgi:hypothetical protein
MPVTEADFNLQGRVDNYRERLTELLVSLDGLVRKQMDAVNGERLDGKGAISYEIRPPRWTLSWRPKGHRFNFEATLMAFAQGGAWVIQGRMGLDRPFRNLKSVRDRDQAAIRQEILDQVDANEVVL